METTKSQQCYGNNNKRQYSNNKQQHSDINKSVNSSTRGRAFQSAAETRLVTREKSIASTGENEGRNEGMTGEMRE